MSRMFIRTPDVRLSTSLGPVRLGFTDARHVFVSVEAHINDDKPAMVFRGQEYIGGVHLYAEPGEGLPAWSAKPGEGGSWSKRPQWVDAPRTHREALDNACAEAVRAYLVDHPDILRAAEYADANNTLLHLDTQRAELATQLATVDAAITAATERLDRNRPDLADVVADTYNANRDL